MFVLHLGLSFKQITFSGLDRGAFRRITNLLLFRSRFFNILKHQCSAQHLQLLNLALSTVELAQVATDTEGTNKSLLADTTNYISERDIFL